MCACKFPKAWKPQGTVAGCGVRSCAPSPPRAENLRAISASLLPELEPGIPEGCVSSAVLPLLRAGSGQDSSATVASSFAGN